MDGAVSALTPAGAFVHPRRNPLSWLGREASQLMALLGEGDSNKRMKNNNQVLQRSLL